MNKFIKQIDNTTLSTEMIAIQDRDYIIKALNDRFKELITAVKDTGLVGEKIYRDKRTANIIASIDQVILERFGIPSKHIYSIDVPYAVYSAPPKNYNVLFENLENHYDEVEGYVKKLKIEKENVKSVNQITSNTKDVNDVLYRWKESVDSLEKVLTTEGLLIDLEKAKIFNLPKEYSVFFMSDFYLLIDIIDLEPEELTAVLLHEIGHAFTHLEYSVRTVHNTNVVLDTIQYNLKEKNQTYKKSLLVAYEKIGGSTKDIENSNTTTVFLTLMDRYIKTSQNIDENTHSKSDSEQLADQFATRFNVGVELTTAIEKVQAKMKNYHFTMAIENSMSTLLLGTFWSIAITGSILGGIGLFGIMTVGVMLVVYFVESILSVATHGNQAQGQVYDYDKRRYMRIKNDLIRQLRKSKLPKEVIRSKLKDIKRIEVLIEKAEPEDSQLTYIDKLVRAISPAGKVLADNKKLGEIVEDLMENDLHIAANKLKTL